MKKPAMREQHQLRLAAETVRTLTDQQSAGTLPDVVCTTIFTSSISWFQCATQ